MTSAVRFVVSITVVLASCFPTMAMTASLPPLGPAPGVSAFGSPADTTAHVQPASEQSAPPTLLTLQQLVPKNDAVPEGTSTLRYDTLREVAHTLGVQAGVRHRYEIINARLHEQRRSLDRLFDFRPFLLHDGRVAPPVIDRTDGAYRLASTIEAHQTQATYRIERDARLITRAPDWRDYLVHSYPAFTAPDDAVLPRNAAERRIWATAAEAGFWAGVAQAEALFDAHLARLRRDYLGMAQFTLLALQGVVEVPVLAESRLGVVVEGRMLSIGERLFRIPASVDFRPVQRWRPVIRYVPASAVQVAPPPERAP